MTVWKWRFGRRDEQESERRLAVAAEDADRAEVERQRALREWEYRKQRLRKQGISWEDLLLPEDRRNGHQ